MSTSEWSAGDLLQVSGGYWAACALHAAVRLDLFTCLGESPLGAEELAEKVGADGRATAMLLNALAALGLVEKAGDRYVTTAFSRRHLAKDGESYLGHIIMHHHHLVTPWARLPEAVISGQPVRESAARSEEEHRESFLMGMFDLAMATAPKIVPHIDLSGRRRLLDLGGGPGTYAIHFCRLNPSLTATVFDLPGTRPFAEKTIAKFGLDERIDFVAGDFQADPIPGTYDVAWLSHVLHMESPEGCANLLEKTAAALEPGGLVLVHEFILDDTMDAPTFPALFSLNMLLNTEDGQAYSRQQICDMLADAGFESVERLDLDLPNGAGVIAGSKRG